MLTAGHMLVLWLLVIVVAAWAAARPEPRQRPRIDPRPVNRRVPR